MRKQLAVSFVIIAVLVLFTVQALAEIDMVNRKVSVTGIGTSDTSKKIAKQRFGALRVAEADALRQLLEEIKGIYIDSETTVKDFVLESDRIRTQVEGVAKYFEMIGKPAYQSDGSVEVTIEMSLDGIDWKNKAVQSVGIGYGKKRALAVRAAKIDAKRKLVERIKGLYLSSYSIMTDGELEIDEINMQTKAVLTNAHFVEGSIRDFEDGSIQVTYEVKLDNDFNTVPGFNSLLLGKQEFSNDNYTASSTNSNAYTGLIIDCRNINLRPALAPKVISKSGKEIYGSANVSRDFATKQGMVGYVKDLNKAKSNKRVGSNPLIITAVEANGLNKTDMVVTDEIASKISEISKNMNFLRECRVVVVIK